MTKNSINDEKTFAQFAESIMRNIAMTMNCVKIGEIVSFDKTDQTATVRILHRIDENYSTGLKETYDYPLLGKVPVVILQGGGAHITFPIIPGDQCLIVFCDYMIDNWWVSGDVSSSDFPRKHDLSDAIAFVGLNALPRVIQNYSDYLHLQYNQNSSIVIGEQIDVNNPVINLNGTTNVSKDVNVVQKVTAAQIAAGNGASGTFTSSDGKTITIVEGVVTGIA